MPLMAEVTFFITESPFAQLHNLIEVHNLTFLLLMLRYALWRVMVRSDRKGVENSRGTLAPNEGVEWLEGP